ncbi:hypothetical protein SprV_0301050400 [Sparganum proliferum]
MSLSTRMLLEHSTELCDFICQKQACQIEVGVQTSVDDFKPHSASLSLQRQTSEAFRELDEKVERFLAEDVHFHQICAKLKRESDHQRECRRANLYKDWEKGIYLPMLLKRLQKIQSKAGSMQQHRLFAFSDALTNANFRNPVHLETFSSAEYFPFAMNHRYCCLTRPQPAYIGRQLSQMEAVPRSSVRTVHPPSHLSVQQQTILPCGRGQQGVRRDPSCLVDIRYRPPVRRSPDGCKEWSVAEMKQQADFMRLLVLGGEKNALNWANLAYVNAKSTGQ